MSVQVSGTEGYAEEARELFKRYETVPAKEAHRAVLHLIPPAPGNILDIGSGTGRDAAWFAALGHRGTATHINDSARTFGLMLQSTAALMSLYSSQSSSQFFARQARLTRTLTQLTGRPRSQNSLQHPTAVVPRTHALAVSGGVPQITLPAYSVSVLRLTGRTAR